MRIRIEADPIGPLKVLSELPEARLAILEGLNGIGKTLAVRILELCTGALPYPLESPAWNSLRAGLGEFRVSVTGLRDDREIRWRGDSRDWGHPPADGVSPLQFREILVDGRSATLDQVRGLLVVHRVAGDESLVETLAQQADVAAESVRRWARRYADQNAGPLAELEEATSGAIRLLGAWSLEAYRSKAASLEDARVQARGAAKLLEEAQRRRDELASALDLANRLAEMHGRAPDLAQRLQEVDEQIGKVEAEREDVRRRVQGLAGQVAAAQPLLKELRNARRTLDRNRHNLSDLLNAAAMLEAALGTSADSNAVSTLISEFEEQVASLNAERATLDAAPMMRTLLDTLSSELAGAEGQGLGNQIALEDSVTEIQLTVAETRAGMSTRRAYLEGRPPAPEAREVTERLEHATRSLHRLRQLDAALVEAERLRRLVAQSEDRVRVALAAINPNAGSQMESLEVQRRESDDRLLQLAAERAALRQQLGATGDGTTESALTAHLAQALKQIAVDEAGLATALVEAEQALRRIQLDLVKVQDTVASVRGELARASIEIRMATEALMSDKQLTWIRTTFAQAYPVPIEADTPQQQLARIDAARKISLTVNDRLGELRSQLGAVESALRGVARHLRGMDPQAVRYLPQLQSWMGERFSDWFNNARVRHELLPTAEGDVAVNVGSREVVWTEHDSARSRPLEAFSSGEQAFAYTRARLAILDEEQAKPANRLIVLDEFGAFIAHDRLAGLLAYLQERARENVEDQVLVVLPLSRDYAELAKTAYGNEAERFARLAEEITARQYAVQPLVR
jgi:hypothetical protein